MAATQHTLIDLKKYLRNKTEYELIEEIAKLYKTFPQVKEFYQSSFFDNDDEVLEKYKKIVIDEYIASGRSQFPKMRASVARKAISDYKKVSCSNFGIADIMMTFVESGINCALEYGDINEPFYNSMEGMFEKAIKFIVAEELFLEFDARLKSALVNTCDMGWGFNDSLIDIYESNTQNVL